MGDEKKIRAKLGFFLRKKIRPQNAQNRILRFSVGKFFRQKKSDFCPIFFDFFESEDFFFRRWKKIWGIASMQKLSDLSIYDVFRAFGVRQI